MPSLLRRCAVKKLILTFRIEIADWCEPDDFESDEALMKSFTSLCKTDADALWEAAGMYDASDPGSVVLEKIDVEPKKS